MTKEEREKAIDLLDNLIGMVEDNQDNDYDFALKKGIESLREQHCEDAVSRKKIEKLKKWRFSYDTDTTIPKSDLFVKLTDIRDLPSVTPTRKWIPCSERLPKESGFYLVSTTDCITIMEFCKGWISQNIGSCNWYVKAWQPLPKQYKAEMESEE